MNLLRFKPSQTARTSHLEAQARLMQAWRTGQAKQLKIARDPVAVADRLAQNSIYPLAITRPIAPVATQLSASSTDSDFTTPMNPWTAMVPVAPSDTLDHPIHIPEFVRTFLERAALPETDRTKLLTKNDLMSSPLEALQSLNQKSLVELLGNKLYVLILHLYLMTPRRTQPTAFEEQIFEWALSSDLPLLQEQAMIVYEGYFSHEMQANLVTQNGNFARIIIEPGPRITRRLLHKVHPSKKTRDAAINALDKSYIKEKLVQLGFSTTPNNKGESPLDNFIKLSSTRDMGRRRRYANMFSAMINKFKGQSRGHELYRNYINGVLSVLQINRRNLSLFNQFLMHTTALPDELLEAVLEEAPTAWTHSGQINDEMERVAQWHKDNILEHLLIGNPTTDEQRILKDIFGNVSTRRGQQVYKEFLENGFILDIIQSCYFMNHDGRARLRHLITSIYQEKLKTPSAKEVEDLFGIKVDPKVWAKWTTIQPITYTIDVYGQITKEVRDLALALKNEMVNIDSVLPKRRSLIPFNVDEFLQRFHGLIEDMNVANEVSDFVTLQETANHFVRDYKPYSNFMQQIVNDAGHFPGMIHKIKSLKERINQFLRGDNTASSRVFSMEITKKYDRLIHLGDHPHPNCLSTTRPMGPNIDGEMFLRPLSPFCGSLVFSQINKPQKGQEGEKTTVAFCDVELRFVNGVAHFYVDLDYTSRQFIQIDTLRSHIYSYAINQLGIPQYNIHFNFDEIDESANDRIPTLQDIFDQVSDPVKRAALEKAYKVYRDSFFN